MDVLLDLAVAEKDRLYRCLDRWKDLFDPFRGLHSVHDCYSLQTCQVACATLYVPISAGEFFQGLAEKFRELDGTYFISGDHQARRVASLRQLRPRSATSREASVK